MRNFHISSGGIDAEVEKIENVCDITSFSHCHASYEILYVIDGKGRCVIEGAEYPVKPRCVFLFPPMVYRALYLEDDSVYERLSITFEERHVSSSVLEILRGFGTGEKNLSPAAFYSADTVCDQIATVAERFESADAFPEPQKTKFMELLVSELILLISMASDEDSIYDESELGARVIRYLNENAVRDISLDKLAKRFFVSKYHLCRAFKKHNGISVHGYINKKRVIHAKQLIESGETASSAAYQVGFGDYSAFYRAYVKIIGKPPTSNEKQKRTKG